MNTDAQQNTITLDADSMQDMNNFFNLLLKIDKRENPHLYETEVNNKPLVHE